ncbi:Retrovirus-related Pol polyprotein from transposon TNT 1-94 [Cucumis melo var. makuwa]|uniref:Retrovirus-related Pol polyprotein from transposon TNT 1-94 n=1 Tax=Cucumis melo var. makuwa TaxID=1194695 RepID=A0A5D3CAZ8_CUCMM|nr:Retrovirus-related Pol polyprotein from transposon TNT 1-94 [Cucumis melo var. makuwa]
MKDLGEADVILGIKIARTEDEIFLDQTHYVEKILKKYNYFDSKPACTPYDSSVKLFKNTGDSVNQYEDDRVKDDSTAAAVKKQAGFEACY